MAKIPPQAGRTYLVPVPFPDPVLPEQEPFRVIPSPEHLSNEIWQTSYYDATSHAPMGNWTQRPAGPCDLATGRFADGDWSSSGKWKQV